MLSVLSSLSQLTIPQCGLICVFIWASEFSFFSKAFSKYRFLPLTSHLALCLSLGLGWYYSQEAHLSYVLTVALSSIFVVFRLFAILILDTHRVQMASTSFFYAQTASVLGSSSLHHHNVHNTSLCMGPTRQNPQLPIIPIVLVLAHPDDESMFCSPLLQLLHAHNEMMQHDHREWLDYVLRSSTNHRSGATSSSSAAAASSSSSPSTSTLDQLGTESSQNSILRTMQSELDKDESGVVSPPYGALYNVYLLCLSTGNADGLGLTRKQELIHTCSTVHHIPIEHIKIVDDQIDLADGMQTKWVLSKARHEIRTFLEEQGLLNAPAVLSPGIYGNQTHPLCNVQKLSNASQSQNARRGAPQQPSFAQHHLAFHDIVIITFDKDGISHHPNHIATSEAVETVSLAHNTEVQRQLVSLAKLKLSNDSASSSSSSSEIIPSQQIPRLIRVFTIESTPLWVKYLGPYAATVLLSQQYGSDKPLPRGEISRSAKLVIPSSSSIYSWQAMQGHASQWVWFRKLFVLYSVYTYVTPLIEIDVMKIHHSVNDQSSNST